MNGSTIRPRKATIAPDTPNQRLPSTIEALPMFGPGRNWQRPMVSTKSACVSQRRSSTIVRCAHGITPPNERAPMARKPVKSSLRLRGGVTSIFSCTITYMRTLLAALVLIPLCLKAQQLPVVFSADERAHSLSHGPCPPAPRRDPSNRVSGKAEAIALGERLFFEPRLSSTGSVLCATCHAPFRAFQDARARGFGLQEVDRNTPSVINVGFYRWYGWDGAHDSLWAQSIRPMLEAREMRATPAHIASLLRARYAADYERAFGRPVPKDDEEAMVDAGKARAAYQETLVSGRTPFDDFRDALEQGDLLRAARYPAAAQRGLAIFVGKGNCSACHS